MSPLNEDLYERLFDRFGEVSINNQGEETLRHGDQIIATGERYIIDCPFCYGRQKVYISYEWGTYDRIRDTSNWGRVICFKWDCLDDQSNFEELRQQVYCFQDLTRAGARQRRLGLKPGRPGIVWTGEPVDLPGDSIPLTHLTENDPARMYLTGRGFDVAELVDTYGVQYCVDVSGRSQFQSTNRIIVPVRRNGVTVAWQGRKIGDAEDGRPKYFNHPGPWKSQVLYGLDEAKGHDFVVIVEGVTDVWRIGPPAIAILGKKPSPTQVDLLHTHLAGALIVVFADDDQAWEAAKPTYERMVQQNPELVIAKVSDSEGRDPGSIPKAEAWELIREAAVAAGRSVALGI